MCFKVRCTFGRPLGRRRKSSWDQFCGQRPSLQTEKYRVECTIKQFCVAGAEEPKLNCRIYGSVSLPFYQRLEEILQKRSYSSCIKLHKKVNTQIKKVLFILFKVLSKTVCDKKKSKGRENVRLGAGAGAVNLNYGSAERSLTYMYEISCFE